MGMKILIELVFFHSRKLVELEDSVDLDTRKCSFSQKTINEWNKLSTDCVNGSSVIMLKNKVDTYLRKAGYTEIFFLGLCGFLVHLPSGPSSWMAVLLNNYYYNNFFKF